MPKQILSGAGIISATLALFMLFFVPKSFGFSRELGNQDARLTVIEYSDYQCPYCAEFELKVLPRLVKRFKNRVLFVFRDMPLSNIHPYAVFAAEVADCAYIQGTYFKVRYLLFKYQSVWVADIKKMPEILSGSVNGREMESCLSSGAELPMLKKNIDYEVRHNLHETPTFKLVKNGKVVYTIQGSQSYKYMVYVIKYFLTHNHVIK